MVSGALAPIETSCEIHEEQGIAYQLRVLRRPNPKLTTSQRPSKKAGNPFSPPEAELLVADISPDYVVVLNKFNVVSSHLLLVTREYVSQTEPLTVSDFEALLTAMDGVNSLGFFNGGLVAGASQPHRHLQVVPLPFEPAPTGLPTPVDAVISEATVDLRRRRCSALPFDHRLILLASGDLVRRRAAWMRETYETLREDLGLAADTPFNLLLSPRWMMVVRRRAECFEGISVNALGFVGSLLVPDEAARKRVLDVGPGPLLDQLSGAGP